MRDIVSETGTFFTGLAALPTVTTTQTSPTVDLSTFDGCMFYILSAAWTAGSMTPVIQESPDGTTWNNVAATDLVAWSATSATSSTPVKLNDGNGNPTGHSQPNAITSAATAINQRVGYVGGQRYVRIVSTAAGFSGGYDVVILAGRPRFMPSNV